MMKMYGAPICSTCRETLPLLEQKGIPCEYIDITANIKNLREFLAIRDSHKEFDAIREQGRVGIPFFVMDDGTLIMDADWLADTGCKDC